MKKILGTLTIAVFILSAVLTAHAAPYQDDFPFIDDPGIDLLLSGDNFSSIFGEWYGTQYAGNDIHFAGEGGGQWVEYTVSLAASGNYNVGINVEPGIYQDGQGLPDGYDTFWVNFTDGATDVGMAITAAIGMPHYGFVNTNLLAGDYTVRYTWLNRVYVSPSKDAKLQINEAFFDYNPVPIPGALLLLGSGLAGLGIIRRKIGNA